MGGHEAIAPYRIEREPYYRPVADEVELFDAAYAARMPMMLKGPTGCGKTRFIEHMAWRLGKPLVTVACNEDMTASARAWAQKHLDRLVTKAKAAKLRVRGVIVDGVAHEQIVRTARGRKASLIVMGTHGRTGVARFLLGSVAARVAATAPCPVLTVRGR